MHERAAAEGSEALSGPVSCRPGSLRHAAPVSAAHEIGKAAAATPQSGESMLVADLAGRPASPGGANASAAGGSPMISLAPRLSVR